MRISDWSSDVCSSDLRAQQHRLAQRQGIAHLGEQARYQRRSDMADMKDEIGPRRRSAEVGPRVPRSPLAPNAIGEQPVVETATTGGSSCREKESTYVSCSV